MCQRSLTTALVVTTVSAFSLYCATGVLGPQAMGETHQAQADVLRSQFLQRLRRVADGGNLFEQKTVAPILKLKLEPSTIERDLALSCPAHFRATTVTVTSGSWFRPLPSGNGHLRVPPFTINPATVTGDPELCYQIIHYVYCGEWARLRPDGGVDLLLRKSDKTYPVQCKQWKTRNVGVAIVRELYGIIAAERAAVGYVITSGKCSPEAHSFAAKCAIILIDGGQLSAMITSARQNNVISIRSSESATRAAIKTKALETPICPRCRRLGDIRGPSWYIIAASQVGNLQLSPRMLAPLSPSIRSVGV